METETTLSHSFEELGISSEVQDALAARGIHAPFPIQELVMNDALDGYDVLAKAPTGSGKTLAFAIPIVEQIEPGGPTPAALILVPTRELASQVRDEIDDIARARGLRVDAVYGGTNMQKRGAGCSKADILVATPGRLTDLVGRHVVYLEDVEILVLDEADRMLDMGFQPQVDRIVKFLPRDRQTMFFSATLDGEVGRLAKAYTHDPARHESQPLTETVVDFDHRFISITMDDKVETLVSLLENEVRELALIFVRTRRGADRLTYKLKHKGVAVAAMHGDMTQKEREQTLSSFETGKVKTLIATDVAARGLDLDDITHVINYDPPDEAKSYVHRVGRTGRAGRKGIGITLVLPEQRGDVSQIANALNLQKEFQLSGMKLIAPRMVYTSKGRNPFGRATAKPKFRR